MRWVLLAAILIGCSQPEVSQHPSSNPAALKSETAVESAGLKRLSTKYLPNAVQVHAKVISGGLPENDAVFQELQSLGVKTIISVDGAKPDVKTAARYGLRYIHLPHGYDGMPNNRVKELAKAVRDLTGPSTSIVIMASTVAPLQPA